MIIWKVTPTEHILGSYYGFEERDSLWTDKGSCTGSMRTNCQCCYFCTALGVLLSLSTATMWKNHHGHPV